MEDIKTGYDAVMFLGRKINNDFYLSEDRKRIYKTIYETIMQREGGRGLLIIGNTGVGKSTCMRIMQKIFIDTVREFVSVDALRLKDMLDDYKVSEIKKQYGFDLKKDLYLDDIGIGQAEISRFSNVTNIVGELLWERDELFHKDGFRTHLSSNLPTADRNNKDAFTIEKVYGDRIFDRIKGITRLIEWPGESLRGKKY